MEHAASFEQKISTNIVSSVDDLDFSIENLKRKIDLATGQKKVDLVVKNANIVNVFSGEIHKGNVAIADGIFVGFGQTEEYMEYHAQSVIDVQGKFMCPGLVDGHIHLESTFLAPREFCNIVALHGTSAVICDPHEIANVLGLPGIDYFIGSTIGLPVKVYVMMPSCVPATHMETSGAVILDRDIHEYMDCNPDLVIGLAEMMNYPGVISKDSQTLSKLIVGGSRPKDGHAPLLSGKSLDAYIIAGLGSDHECTNLKEAIEKIRKGMHIMIRQGAHEKNLQDLISLINDFNSSHISLVSDDRDVIDLKENGHMDYLVRTAISFGLPPIRAIQMASINTARYFGLKNMGAIAPGFRADFILLDNLESFIISEVFLSGKRIDTNSSSNAGGKIKGVTSDIHVNNRSSPSSLSILQNTIHIKGLDDPNMFAIPKSTKCSTSLLVIGVIPGQIITQKRIIEPKVNEDYCPVADAQRDIAKLAVIERHHRTGNLGLGFVQGLGLQRGAIASSVAHDSHNLVAAGMNDMDMLTAAKHILSIGGGLVVVNDEQVTASLPLPIAGLMSDQSIKSVISNLNAVNEACRKLGNNVIKDPFMLLSFMSLPVIPSLKLTDKGLVDVDKFEFTNLWV
ncbi:MAG TPA: adenine deaminase, partial [Nitrososphaeraceae archaeon]